MGFDAEDKEIVRLITKLKNTDGAYPPDLLATRRQRYLKQMGEIGLVVGAGASLKNAIQGSKASAVSSTTSTVLESALIVAIVAETGTVAYFYRDKLASLFHSVTKETKVQQASPSPVHTEPEILGVTLAPAVASMLPSEAVVINPTEIEISSTPIPDVVENNAVNATSAVNPANVTEAPKDNNGHHYGQTPKPARTKEPKGNNDNPPKDNSQPPKDNSKPPKKK